MEILIHHSTDGFVYYEAVFKGSNLLTFSLRDLINQTFIIYNIDLRKTLFNYCLN